MKKKMMSNCMAWSPPLKHFSLVPTRPRLVHLAIDLVILIVPIRGAVRYKNLKLNSEPPLKYVFHNSKTLLFTGVGPKNDKKD